MYHKREVTLKRIHVDGLTHSTIMQNSSNSYEIGGINKIIIKERLKLGHYKYQ